MPERRAALAQASGTVADRRRLVAFVYLLLRDNMTCGKFAEVMALRTTITSSVFLYQGLDVGVLEGFADRLTSSSRAPVCDWLALVFRHSEHPERIPSLIERLPADDDIETVFTNGWLAQYAQYTADELLALTDADACT